MKTRINKLFILSIIAIATSCSQENKESAYVPRYVANFDSLSVHNQQPDWFQDAKLGIYFHWGVYSVPAFANEWYPRKMHFEEDIVFSHHKLAHYAGEQYRELYPGRYDEDRQRYIG